MPSTDYQTLLSEGKCYACFGELSVAQTIRMALLARTAAIVAPSVSLTPQSLMGYGNCYACLGISEADIMELSLLDIISQNITGTTEECFMNLIGTGSPMGAQTPQEIGQFYTDDSGPYLWQATGLTDTDWVQLTSELSVPMSALQNPDNTAVPTIIAVGASPFTYTNATTSREVVYVAGGTITQTFLNAQTILGNGNQTVMLQPGESITVQYTVLPTMQRKKL